MRIQIGEFAVGRGETSIETYALGSCVGLCLWDNIAQIGGMAHILLPDSSAIGRSTITFRSSDLCKYADHASELLLLSMTRMGANRSRMVALIAGGATMFSFGAEWMAGQQVGEKNVQAVLRHLREMQIPVQLEETGGKTARSIRFDIDTGQLSTIARESGKQPSRSISKSASNAKRPAAADMLRAARTGESMPRSAADMLQAARNAVK